jgi:hypothetical protein
MAKQQQKKKTKKPSAAPKDICFTIMPFGGWLDDYYRDIYCPAIEAAGLEPHRADDLFRPSTIVNDIWAYTKRARIILADLSGKNPNVFYELGMAHALAKPAILVAESMDDVPFDLRALRVLVYDKNAPQWGDILSKRVESSIREVLKSPAEAVLPAFLETKGGTPKPTLTPQAKEFLDLRQQVELLREEIRSPERPKQLRPRLDPEEARERIVDYLAKGIPESEIVRELTEQGVPQWWAVDKVDTLRSEKRRPAASTRRRVAHGPKRRRPQGET